MKARLPQPDFLRPQRRIGLLAWAWLAGCAALLAAAALHAHGAWSARQQALQQLALAQQPVLAAAPPPLSPADQARRAEAERWLQRRAHPWPAVWAAGEAASAEGIHWLGLAHGDEGELRLDGLAPSPAAAQAAAQALRRQQAAAGPRWQAVLLARLERSGEGQRFELQARLAPPPGRLDPTR